MDALPPMRPLVMVLKVFLQQRELNEVRLAAPLAPQLVLREFRGCNLALRPPYLLLLPLFCLPSPVILCPLRVPLERPVFLLHFSLVHFVQVYSGGLGSYALLVMVASFIQLHPSRQQPGGCQALALMCGLSCCTCLQLRLQAQVPCAVRCVAGCPGALCCSAAGLLRSNASPAFRLCPPLQPLRIDMAAARTRERNHPGH
jgi:hypothetical protein